MVELLNQNIYAQLLTEDRLTNSAWFKLLFNHIIVRRKLVADVGNFVFLKEIKFQKTLFL